MPCLRGERSRGDEEPAARQAVLLLKVTCAL